MLSLLINDKHIDLSNDISITLKFTSPIFNQIGDYTYPFKLPATSNNISILGYKHRVENANNPYEVFSAILLWKGITILKGTLRVLSAQSDFYEATLFMDKGDFVYRRKSMTLQDIDFGSYTWQYESQRLDYFNNCRNINYPLRDFALPMILDMQYYEELPDDPMLYYLNYYHWDNLQILFQGTYRAIFVPMLYLRCVLDRIFKKLEYVFEDQFFSMDSEYNALALFNSVDANSDVTGPFNYPTNMIVYNYHVPRMTMNEFLSGLESFFNIRFFVNNITRVVKLISVDKIVKSIESIDFSSNVNSIYTLIGEPVKGFHLKMNMETADAIWPQYQSNQALIIDAIKDAVETFSELPVWPSSPCYEIRYVRSEGIYYIMGSNYAWTQCFLNENTSALKAEFVHHESDVVLETKFSTLAAENTSPFRAVIGTAQSEWNGISPKLLFVKFYPNTGGNYDDECVYASNFSTSHSLFYNGPNGLYSKHFKAYFEFMMQAKSVKIIKQMNLLELNEIDFSKKYSINGNNYLLSEIQATITNAGIKPATIKAFACL